MQIHKFIIPDGGIPLVIRELSAEEVIRITQEAARKDNMALLMVEEQALRRLACVRQYGDLLVGEGRLGAHDVLAAMPARHQRFLDRAISAVHDVAQQEVDAFLASRSTMG